MVIFIVWIDFISLEQKPNLKKGMWVCESHKKVCENKDFCNGISPSEDKCGSLINKENLLMHHLLFMQILNV